MRKRLRPQLLSIAAAAIAALTACDRAPFDSAAAQSAASSGHAHSIADALKNPDAWETIAGRWSAETRGDRQVLLQSATDQKYPVALLRGPTFSDVDVTVQFRPLSGKIDASGGIVFRARDGANYYVVRANSLEDNFRLYATVAGNRKQIATTRIDAPAIGQWHTLRVVAAGDHIQAYLDGKLLLDHHDSRFKSGRVGLWTKADAVTEFAHFSVTGVVDKASK